MIGVVDYGSGNVLAFINVYKKLNIPARLVRGAEELGSVDRAILPGVGCFDYAMERLDRSGLRPALEEAARVTRIPILGVCVGMQMLAASSQEGRLPGLGWIAGEVKRFESSYDKRSIDVPHMGWNDVRPLEPGGLFRGLEQEARFYFLHSYYFECANAGDAAAVTDYGVSFASAVNKGNIFGVQFHPEKSHQGGARLLSNFAEI